MASSPLAVARHERIKPRSPPPQTEPATFRAVVFPTDDLPRLEWSAEGYARAYRTSDKRAAELPIWTHQYNWHRPHGSLKSNPPISRLGLTGDNLIEAPQLEQPEESGNQVNVICVTADGVNEHVVPELVLSSPVSAGKPDFRNFMAPTLTDFDDMVQAAFTVLPKKYTHLCDAVMIQVNDFPHRETLEKVHSKNKFGVLGTFHGRAQFKAENPSPDT